MRYRLGISLAGGLSTFVVLLALSLITHRSVHAAEEEAVFGKLQTLARQVSYEFDHGNQDEILELGEYSITITDSTGKLLWSHGDASISSTKSPIIVKTIDGLSGRYPLTVEGTTYTVAAKLESDFAISAALERQLTWLVPLFAVLVGGITMLATGLVSRRLQNLVSQAAIIAKQPTEAYLHVQGDDEVAGVAQSLNKLLKRVFDEIQFREDTVADLAHDLRSPLTAIRGRLETGLLTRDDNEKLASAIELAVQQSQRMSIQIDRTLDLYSRPEAGKSASIAEVWPELNERWAKLLATNECAVAIEGDLIPVPLSSSSLITILDNLIGNAVRHNNHPSILQLAVKSTSEEVVLLADSASQMASKSPPRAGQRSYGRGLRIVDRLVHLSGGEITTSLNTEQASFSVLIRWSKQS